MKSILKWNWGKDEHEVFASEYSYVSGNKLSTNGITIVKLGAVANDKYLGSFNTYPQFHGFTRKQVRTPTYSSNYMASYIYLANSTFF